MAIVALLSCADAPGQSSARNTAPSAAAARQSLLWSICILPPRVIKYPAVGGAGPALRARGASLGRLVLLSNRRSSSCSLVVAHLSLLVRSLCSQRPTTRSRPTPRRVNPHEA